MSPIFRALHLSHDYGLYTGPGNDFANINVESIAAIGGTGHDHIVSSDRGGVTVVGVYKEEEGTGETLTVGTHGWELIYLARQARRSWSRSSLAGLGPEIVSYARDEHQVELGDVMDQLLAGQLPISEMHRRVAPGTIVHRFHQLEESAPDAAAALALHDEAPWYGAPLRLALEGGAKEALRRFVYQDLRWDLGSSLLIDRWFPEAAEALLADPDFADDPLRPMLQRVASGVNYWEGARGYFEAAQVWAERKDRRALACLHNALWLERMETEEYHHRAWAMLQSLP